jgi:hypothetical protein
MASWFDKFTEVRCTIPNDVLDSCERSASVKMEYDVVVPLRHIHFFASRVVYIADVKADVQTKSLPVGKRWVSLIEDDCYSVALVSIDSCCAWLIAQRLE